MSPDPERSPSTSSAIRPLVTCGHVIEAARIKVAVVPVGISPDHDRFVHALTLLRECETVQMAELLPDTNRPFTKHFGTKGRIFAGFVTDPYRDFDDFDEFQAYRRIFGVCTLALFSGDRAVQRDRGGDSACFPEGPFKVSACHPLSIDFRERRARHASDGGRLYFADHWQLWGLVGSAKERAAPESTRARQCGSEGGPAPASFAKEHPLFKARRRSLHPFGRIRRGNVGVRVPSHICTGLPMLSRRASRAETRHGRQLHRRPSSSPWLCKTRYSANACVYALQMLFLYPPQNASPPASTCAEIWLTMPDKLAEVAALYDRVALPILAWDVHRTISRISRELNRIGDSILYITRSWQSCQTMHPEEKAPSVAVLLDPSSGRHD